MILYVTHPKSYDYKNELYLPLRQSDLSRDNQLILPHELTDEPYNSKGLLLNNKCDIVLAEVSNAATGQGIELGWANAKNIPIICFYKINSKISGSLKVISQTFIEYSSPKDMIDQLSSAIKQYE